MGRPYKHIFEEYLGTTIPDINDNNLLLNSGDSDKCINHLFPQTADNDLSPCPTIGSDASLVTLNDVSTIIKKLNNKKAAVQ